MIMIMVKTMWCDFRVSRHGNDIISYHSIVDGGVAYYNLNRSADSASPDPIVYNDDDAVLFQPPCNHDWKVVCGVYRISLRMNGTSLDMWVPKSRGNWLDCQLDFALSPPSFSFLTMSDALCLHTAWAGIRVAVQ